MTILTQQDLDMQNESKECAEYVFMRLESEGLTKENLATWINDHFSGVNYGY